VYPPCSLAVVLGPKSKRKDQTTKTACRHTGNFHVFVTRGNLLQTPGALFAVSHDGIVAKRSGGQSYCSQSEGTTCGDTREIRKEIDQFREFFKEEIKKGDVFDMVYFPSYGVIVIKNGKRMGSVTGAMFKQALFSIWLCDNPADEALKQALLTPQKFR
jgi:hypothetical protein